MKKLLILMLFIFLTFGFFNHTNAWNQTIITDKMNSFYNKLDSNISDINIKIEKLEIINNKIILIKKKKWDKLSVNSKILINLLEGNINNKILFYKRELENQKEEIDISEILWDINILNYTNNNEDHYSNTNKWWLYLFLSENATTNKGTNDFVRNENDINISWNQWKDVADINLSWKNEDIQIKTIKLTFNKNIREFNKIGYPQIDIYRWSWKSWDNYLWTNKTVLVRWWEVLHNFDNLIIKEQEKYKMYISAHYDWIEATWIKLLKVEIIDAKWLKSWKNVIEDMNTVWYNDRLRFFNLYK